MMNNDMNPLTHTENNDIMGYMAEKGDGMRKFKVGDLVRVRKDLQVGETYYSEDGLNDIFTSRMKDNLGKEGKVIEITYKGYKLDIDEFHTYTEDMLELPVDNLAIDEYMFDVDVERALLKANEMYYKMRIDEGLDNRMFESEPQKFQEIIDKYNSLKKINKSLDKRSMK